MAAKTVERRSFKMHDNLLVSVIKKQAGSLWKAVSEGVMNSIDAKATEIRISLTGFSLVMRDNGDGFVSKEDIEQFFETFGQPHEAHEQKTFGTFRMGRGQLFAFGRNIWRSNTFRMEVDIEKEGLDYSLTCNLSEQPGCEVMVHFYSPMSAQTLRTVVDDIATAVQYVSIPVYVNDTQVNTPPNTIKWTHETAEADILVQPNVYTWRVYNQGVLAVTLADKLPGGGVVVSKVPVQLNFARNELMDSCPVWQRLHKTLVATVERTEKSRRRRTPPMSDDERIRRLQLMVDGTLDIHDVLRTRLFRSFGVNSSWSMRWYTLSEAVNRGGGVMCDATLHSDGADSWRGDERLFWLFNNRLLFPRIKTNHEPELAQLVSGLRNILDAANIPPNRESRGEAATRIHAARTLAALLDRITVTTREQLMAAHVGTDHIPVDATALDPLERLVLAAIEASLQWISSSAKFRVAAFSQDSNLWQPSAPGFLIAYRTPSAILINRRIITYLYNYGAWLSLGMVLQALLTSSDVLRVGNVAGGVTLTECASRAMYTPHFSPSSAVSFADRALSRLPLLARRLHITLRSGVQNSINR